MPAVNSFLSRSSMTKAKKRVGSSSAFSCSSRTVITSVKFPINYSDRCWRKILFRSNSSYFTIVGSKVIRPDTEYHLSVTNQGYKEPTTLKVSINGTEDDGRVYIQSKDVTFTNDQTQTLVYDVSKRNFVWNLETPKQKLSSFKWLQLELELTFGDNFFSLRWESPTQDALLGTIIEVQPV